MNKIIIDPHNCSREEMAELKEYLDAQSWDYKEVEEEQEPDVDYILKDGSIHIIGSHNVSLNEKIREEELHEYGIVHRESLIDDLYRWIGEDTQSKQAMKDDLRMLEEWKDDYIFSSYSTNAYIGSGCPEFNDTCKEMLELNEKL
jgi:hypothetical protein